MITEIRVFDDFLADPVNYRKAALRGEFKTFEFPGCAFHGISTPTPSTVPEKICHMFPGWKASLSFFRKSPIGQEEPHFIHTDIDMGEWSAILYLNPEHPTGDGTAFWTHVSTNTDGSRIPHERSEEGKSARGWMLRRLVIGKFNRLVIFPSHLFHSRGIPQNWGKGDAARLTQVTFGTLT